MVVYGHRRVGKIFLVRKFFHDAYAFHFVGSRNCATPLQLKRFNDELVRASGRNFECPKTWSEAFLQLRDYLEQEQNNGKKVVFFDEMPWIDNKQLGFVEALEYFWNSWASSRDDVALIACGSATSWMLNNLVENQGGLHNRVTRQIHLRPFNLYEVREYLRSRSFTWSDFQIVQCYMTFGGVPYYLSLLEPELSLEQNITNLMFKNEAPLQREFDELYTALFKQADKYIAIVEALSKKKSGLQKKKLQKLQESLVVG